MAYLINALKRHPNEFTPDEQQQFVREHYNDIATKVEAFATGRLPMRGLIVNGPAGGGKTEVVVQTLNALRSRYHMINGSMSAPQWHVKLYEYARDPEQILVIDDTDIIFDDTQMCDTTKAALDTAPGKTVDYIKTNSGALRMAAVPERFVCRGRVIFITNRPMDSKHMTPRNWARIKPIRDRSHYVAAGLTPAWTGVAMRLFFNAGRIRCFNEDTTVDHQHKQDIINWISDNIEQFPFLSFRTLLKAIGYFKMDSLRWQENLLADTGE